MEVGDGHQLPAASFVQGPGPRFPGLDWDRVIEPPQEPPRQFRISWDFLVTLVLEKVDGTDMNFGCYCMIILFRASWWLFSSMLMWKQTQFWRWYSDLNAKGRVGYGYEFLQRPSLMVGGMAVGLWALLSKHSDWWNAGNVIRERGCNDILMVTMLSI